MASNDDTLSGADISQVTDIISAKNRLRFCVEYLEIDRNEYDTIQDEAKSIHHDTLYECITRWKIRTGAQGKHPKDELIKILNQIRREHGWFPFNAMAFLTDVTGRRIHESSKNFQIEFFTFSGGVLKAESNACQDIAHICRARNYEKKLPFPPKCYKNL